MTTLFYINYITNVNNLFFLSVRHGMYRQRWLVSSV